MSQAYTTVLCIAGSDGSGGAGIQADLKTFTALNCYGLSVITAITAQNTLGVTGVYTLDEKCISAQFRAIADDISIDAVKIGMLGSSSIIKTVAALLRELPDKAPVILDTPLGSSGGRALLPPKSIALLKSELFPLATMITPNLPESAIICGMKRPPATKEEIEVVAGKLLETGVPSVLIKGGHGEGEECRECLLYEKEFFWFSSKKIVTQNTHGTGCTLSSAMAAYMARGESIPQAVEKAKAYTFEALQKGADYRLGHGSGPLHHAFRCWQ